jgi:hypothetical protein
VAHQRRGVVLAEGREDDERRVLTRSRPGRALFEHLGSGEAQQDDRGAAREARDVLEQVEQRRLCPVDVVDDENERALPRKCLEHAAESPQRLLARAAGVVRAERRRDAFRDLLRTLVFREKTAYADLRIRPEHVPERFGQREKRDALAVGDAAPDEDASRVVEVA